MGVINFHLYSAEIKMAGNPSDEYFEIRIEGCERVFYLRGKDSNDT
jgi:hypothetical protein